ncbi:MAG: hypothetical protein NTU85_02975 [Candidatus Kaiserbacteria bacterium]|nr:hypothetical protein [Candidatus Kaiserbacteria bacterium]
MFFRLKQIKINRTNNDTAVIHRDVYEQTDLYRWNPTSEKKGRYRRKRKHLERLNVSHEELVKLQSDARSNAWKHA